MKRWIESALGFWANRLGYDLVPAYVPGLKRPVPPGAKLYVGSGEQQATGYVACDFRPLENVQLVCRAWEVSRFCSGLSEIFSRHMLEHLTLAEAELTLRDWFAALAPSGIVRIEVPNLEFALSQWQRARWNSAELANRLSDARWGFAGLYGWQRECDPKSSDYNQSYWDVHKSGYTAKSMRHFLSQAGFEQIEISFESFTLEQLRRRNLDLHASDNCHLVAVGRKPAAARQNAA